MILDVDAILFDIDGTLVDSTGAVERAWQAFTAAHGIDVDTLLSVSHGRRSADTIADFLPEPEREAAVAELDALELADLDDIVALPAVAELLTSLPRSRWAAVTSGNRVLMERRLHAAGLPGPDVLVTAEDVAEGKPHPEGFLLAARRLGFAPERCLVIEDALSGIVAGLAAGATVLGVATSHDRGSLNDATIVVGTLEEITVTVTSQGLRVSCG